MTIGGSNVGSVLSTQVVNYVPKGARKVRQPLGALVKDVFQKSTKNMTKKGKMAVISAGALAVLAGIQSLIAKASKKN